MHSIQLANIIEHQVTNYENKTKFRFQLLTLVSDRTTLLNTSARMKSESLQVVLNITVRNKIKTI
jgi:hypothetical protein